MSATALALILVAALAHATWNLFSKQASAAGASSFVWLMSLAATGAVRPGGRGERAAQPAAAHPHWTGCS